MLITYSLQLSIATLGKNESYTQQLYIQSYYIARRTSERVGRVARPPQPRSPGRREGARGAARCCAPRGYVAQRPSVRAPPAPAQALWPWLWPAARARL